MLYTIQTDTCRLAPAQHRWAKSHDWFHDYDTGCGILRVKDCFVDAQGVDHEVVKVFAGSFDDLRAWAGY